MKKNLFLTMVLMCIFAQGLVFTACSSKDDEQTEAPAKEYFTLWNDCEALRTLKGYVEIGL